MAINKEYITVTNDLQIQSVIDYINDFDYFAFDTETTGLNVRKDNVIGMSFSGKPGTAYYIARYEWNTEEEQLVQLVSDSAFQKLLEILAEKDLVMWNASFDIRVVYSNFEIDLTEALSADAMLMKHTIEEDGDFKLKSTMIELQEYLGMDMEKAANEEQIELKENVAKNGGSTTKSNFEMYKADLDIMAKYACADADFTLRIAEYYYDKLQDEELEDFFFDKEVMPLYKYVTIPMERHGIHLDMDLLCETKENIIKDMKDLENQVIDSLLELEATNQWLDDLLDKKYPVSNKGSFVQLYCEKFDIPLPKTKSGKYSLTAKSIGLLEDSEHKQFLLTGDKFNIPFEVATQIQEDLHIKKEGSIINISSKKQLGEIVFNYMNVKPISRTEKGAPQFNDTMIQELEKQGFEWARKLGNYNKLVKIKGAYIDRFLDAQEDGIFYPSFFQHRTISGRYGSDMQQLNRPKEEGQLDPMVLKYNNIIRKFFIAGDGRKFIDNDYESLEPHVFAHVSGDEGLKDIFRKGHDFYSTIAIATENIKDVSADKKADNYLGKVMKAVRQAAKAYALGVPYGMTAYALAMTLGITQEQAQILIDGYLDGFPELKKWMKDSEFQAKNLGYVQSEVGRKRHLPQVKKLYQVHKDKLLDFKYRNAINKKYGKDVVLNMYRDYKNGLNNSKNFQIQSLAASIVNMAAIEINKELQRRKIDGWVALQIHDQLVINVPEEKAEECRVMIQDIMENNYKLSIALKAPAEIADNLYDGH